MVPGAYNLPLTENSTNVYSFVISGITTASGYSAAVDLRMGPRPNDTLILSLTSPSGGLTLASDGSSLTVTMTISETQADTAAPTIAANVASSWSLKVTAPGGATTQYLVGLVALTRTPTA